MANKRSGIYIIRSKCKPQKTYIGSAVYIVNRWSQHRGSLRRNKHHSPKLQRHYNKYGEQDLVFEVLLLCDRDDLIKQEQYFLDKYQPYRSGFNICPTAGNNTDRPCSDESRQKTRNSLLGHPVSQETREKIRQCQLGRKKSAELKEKLREMNLGKTLTEEHKRKISEALAGKSRRKGHRHSEETKRKMSMALKGKPSKLKGTKFTAEHIENVRQALIATRKRKKAQEEIPQDANKN